MITRLSWLLFTCAAAGFIPAKAQVDGGYSRLMPAVAQYTPGSGRLDIQACPGIDIIGPADPRLQAESARFITRLSQRTGIFPDRRSGTLQISVHRPGKLVAGEDESYTLDIDARSIRLDAPTDIGAIRGLETIIQLLTADNKGYYLPACHIQDQPRFIWRGLLLDVALHFMPVDVIERTLDGMAAVKMNVLHLHLSNDQGFRVESKTFPRLHQIASDGKYYTRQDIRHILQYAGQRAIRIVPEFVVPAHTTAILTAFPEFASVKRNYSLQRYFGVFDPVMDPTNEKLYPFLDRLFTEMAALFPDKYFHIGGDENTGNDWQHTPHIRDFMKSHGMKNFMDLQTYFNRRIQPFLQKNGKIMMGWDEILQPGTPANIVIQSWRGNEAYYSSIRKGYPAILSYGYYIDLIQPASYHYQNDPIPDSVHLTKEETKRVLGGEATMWSELVDPNTVDSRIWPRTAAIAERLWSPASVKDTDDMYRRLDLISLQLEGLGLRHQSQRYTMFRRLANGPDTHALETLVAVLEPLKIYERNQGDTMYNVFSPLTRLADVAIPDQPLARIFNRQVAAFLKHPTPSLEDSIIACLVKWKDNDSAFNALLAQSPALREAAPLSEALAALAAAGLEAIHAIHDHHKMDPGWLQQQSAVVERARQQSGRCEIQVTSSIQNLILHSAQP